MDDVERDPTLTEVDMLCFTETWNAKRPYIKGYAPVVCIHDSVQPAGGVAVYVMQAEEARNIELALFTESDDGESAAIDFGGITVLTMYLAPNLSIEDVKWIIDRDMRIYDKSKPFMLVGDFNVDITDPNKHWLMHHMSEKYALKCISFENPNPTTIRGTCIDIVFANFHLQPVQEPLSLHFTYHKAVIMKGQRKPAIKV